MRIFRTKDEKEVVCLCIFSENKSIYCQNRKFALKSITVKK